MDLLHAIFLGIVQGLTEFIPISSSGHLVITRDILGVQEASLAFDVILHLGTLVAVFTYYWKDILLLVEEFFMLILQLITYPFLKIKPIIFDKKNEHRTLLIMLIVATIPTAIIGYLFSDIFSGLFESVHFVGYTLLITGGMLWLSNHMLNTKKQVRDMRWMDAIAIGIMQGAAITPGISRSGSTIFGGLLRGFNRELATKFSFLLSIPAILGAAVLEGKEIINIGTAFADIVPVIWGFIAAAVSGYIAIRFLIRLISKQKLHYFSYYCWTVGMTIILYSIFI